MIDLELRKLAYQAVVNQIDIYKKEPHDLTAIKNLDLNSIFIIDQKFSTIYENFQPNQYYGTSALVRYLSECPMRALPIILPHGIPAHQCVWTKELLPGFPIASYSSHMETAYIKALKFFSKDINVFKFQHPIHQYINSDLGYLNNQKNNGLYFPQHSTGLTRVSASKIIDDIKTKVRTIGADLNLCIYYWDLFHLSKLNIWDDYSSYFNEIYCLGSKFHPCFLLNLAHLLKSHSDIYSDHFGSHLVFADMADCKCHILPRSSECYDTNDQVGVYRTDQNIRDYLKAHEAFLYTVISKLSPYHLSNWLKQFYFDSNNWIKAEVNYHLIERLNINTKEIFLKQKFNEALHPIWCDKEEINSFEMIKLNFKQGVYE